MRYSAWARSQLKPRARWEVTLGKGGGAGERRLWRVEEDTPADAQARRALPAPSRRARRKSPGCGGAAARCIQPRSTGWSDGRSTYLNIHCGAACAPPFRSSLARGRTKAPPRWPARKGGGHVGAAPNGPAKPCAAPTRASPSAHATDKRAARRLAAHLRGFGNQLPQAPQGCR
eukprot:scaffold22545_cov126-Isochrysis_galbana.AAC.4